MRKYELIIIVKPIGKKNSKTQYTKSKISLLIMEMISKKLKDGEKDILLMKLTDSTKPYTPLLHLKLKVKL